MAKILVVEDSSTQLSVYKAMLSNKGYTVIHALNGKEGLDKARVESPDVIITDIEMPEMDGLEMIRELKKNETLKYIPVICASAAYRNIETKIKALNDAGAEEYFYLPQTEEELLLKVKVMLRVRNLYLELFKKNEELKKFNNLMIGREERILELKERVRQLERNEPKK